MRPTRSALSDIHVSSEAHMHSNAPCEQDRSGDRFWTEPSQANYDSPRPVVEIRGFGTPHLHNVHRTHQSLILSYDVRLGDLCGVISSLESLTTVGHFTSVSREVLSIYGKASKRTAWSGNKMHKRHDLARSAATHSRSTITIPLSRFPVTPQILFFVIYRSIDTLCHARTRAQGHRYPRRLSRTPRQTGSTRTSFRRAWSRSLRGLLYVRTTRCMCIVHVQFR